MENIRVYIDKLVEFFGGLTRNQKIAAGGGGAVLLIFLLLFSFRGEETTDLAPLYTDLEPAEAGEIVARLRQMEQPYQVLAGGSIVLADEDQVDDLRVLLAAEGLPQSGLIGYKLFDEAKLGMTDFLQKVNNQRAMQDEIAKTLTTIQWVRGARVQLSIPEPSLFTETEKPVTASIMIQVKRGFVPEVNQVKGISLLVARAVPGLREKNVTIVDNTGRLLTEEADPLARQASRQLDMQRNVESYLEKKASAVLERITGKSDRFSVKVSVDLDFDQAERTIESFDPQNTVLRSEERNEESSAEAGTKERTISNYEITKNVSRMVNAPGVVKRRSISVILETPLDPDTETLIPIPQEDVDKVERAIKAAVGYDEQRGDHFSIEQMAFDRTARLKEQEAEAAVERGELVTEIVLNVAKGVAIIIALLVLRAIIGAIGRGVAREEEIAAAAVEGVSEETAEPIPETPHEITLGRIAEMISERPEDAAKLIRTMLLEEAAAGGA